MTSFLLLNEIQKYELAKQNVTNCEVWYTWIEERTSEVTNCEVYELRGIPVVNKHFFEFVKLPLKTHNDLPNSFFSANEY